MILLTTCSAIALEPDLAQLRQQVEDTERAFARSMADRDHAAFTSFLSGEAIFFAGEDPLNGKQQVADAWESFFQAPDGEWKIVFDKGSNACNCPNPTGAD
jgi:ketosteroid isomerase-like protein